MSTSHQPVLLRSKDLKKLVPEKLILRAWRAGWIAPALQKKGFTLWPDNTVAVIKQRLLAGEYPPPLPCEVRKRCLGSGGAK